jgi:hypothetical protein
VCANRPQPLWLDVIVIAGVMVAILVGWLCEAAGEPPIEAPKPSFGFYVRRIAPWTDANCASCHRSAGAGSLRLYPPIEPTDGKEDMKRRELEFESVRRLIDSEAPWKSRLLLKLIGEEQAGLPHAGGTFLRTDDDVYDDLLDFASGATTNNLPPEPEPGPDRRAKPGDDVALDASHSFDRDDDALSYRWELLVRPPGSRASLTETSEKKTAIRPDVGGTYVVRLRVFDGKIWSAPKPVAIEVLDRTGPEAPDAVAASGLAGVDAAALRRIRSVYGDVLGRPPTPPEAILHAGKPSSDVAAILLATIEGGRAFLEDEAYRLGLIGDAEPISRDVQSLPFHLAGGELSPAQAVATLVRDPAWLRAHPAGDALARAVAGLLLDRDATADDLATYREPAALRGLLDSHAFAVAAMRRLAARYLPAADAAAVPESRAAESTSALALSFLSSAAWAGSRELDRKSVV